MDRFNMSELGVFVGICSSACIGILIATQKSKCSSICWGMCTRDVKAVVETEKLELTGHTGVTPRASLAEENKKIKKELELELEHRPATEPE